MDFGEVDDLDAQVSAIRHELQKLNANFERLLAAIETMDERIAAMEHRSAQGGE